MTSIAQWRAGGAYLEHKGHRIFWREGGDPAAPALLLIHGFPTASWDWERLWPELTKRYRVLTLDMIGFGFSQKPYFYDYHMIDQADIFDHLLALARVPRYHILAHDIGVSAAAELVARAAENAGRPQIQSACLLNGTLFPETHRRVLYQSLLLTRFGPLVSLLTTKSGFARNMRTIFGQYFPPDQETLDAMWALIENDHGDRIMHKLISYIPDRHVNRERWVGAVQQTAIPMKLIDGLVDPVSGGHMVVRYRELIPNPNVTELPQGGHYPHVQMPEQVLAAYLAFREEVARTQANPAHARPVTPIRAQEAT